MISFYDVDEDYIKFLKQYDNKIPDIKYATNSKFVCGIVLNIGGAQYYAPISHLTTKQQTNMQIIDKGKPISTIRFSFMFPAPASVLKRKNFSKIAVTDPKYANLLRTEYLFCSKNKQAIYNKAQKVYAIGCNKQHKLNYACCDFKLLESVYNNYKP